MTALGVGSTVTSSPLNTSKAAVTAMETRFHLGNYQGCIDEASRLSDSVSAKSLWLQSLIHLNRNEEAQRLLLSINQGPMHAALSLYADTWSQRNQLKDNLEIISAVEAIERQLSESSELGEENKVQVEETNQTRLILSIIASWTFDLALAYRLAARSPLIEAYPPPLDFYLYYVYRLS